jgi:hypothetical protein
LPQRSKNVACRRLDEHHKKDHHKQEMLVVHLVVDLKQGIGVVVLTNVVQVAGNDIVEVALSDAVKVVEVVDLK